MIQRKRRWTSFDLHCRERSPASDLRSRPAMHTEERKLPATGKGGELPAERSYSVGLAKAVGEEGDAKRRYQEAASKAKLAGKLFSTPGASLRFRIGTFRVGPDSVQPAGHSIRATLTAAAAASTRPRRSANRFGRSPAAATMVGCSIGSGMDILDIIHYRRLAFASVSGPACKEEKVLEIAGE